MRGVLVVGLVACSARHLPPPVPDEPRPPTPISEGQVVTAPVLRLPDHVSPLAYEVRLELDPDREAFRGHVEIRVKQTEWRDHVWLHADGLEFANATVKFGIVDPKPMKRIEMAAKGMVAFRFPKRLDGEMTLAFDYTGHIANNLEGLFRQQAEQQWFVYAQSQATFARRILPCFDEPRWKPTWRVTLVVPKHQVALANGAQTKATELGDGRREHEFAEVANMPSYLFSVAVGPFQLVDIGALGREKVPVRVAVAPKDAKNVDIVGEKLPAIVDELERYLDLALPVAKLDLVAVPEFFGAMENVGLVTFESSILTGNKTNVTAVRRFIRFAAHELAHQWFGNLVTPAWWDDLWLSEGITTWLAERISDDLGASDDPALRAQLARLQALAADAADPRPLRREVISTDVIDDRFDETAYEKGGAVLDMIERVVHRDAFPVVLQSYVTAHANRTATSKDFVAALRMVSNPAAQVLTDYLIVRATPLVELAVDCTMNPVKVELRTGDDARVPMCLRHAKGEVCKQVAEIEHVWLDHCPRWLIGNAGGIGYYRVKNPALAKGAPFTASERLAHADDVADALLRGDLALPVALGELKTFAAGDASSQLAALLIAEAIDPLVDDVTRPAWTRWLAARFAKRLPNLLGAKTQVELELRDRLPTLVGDRFDAKTLAAARVVVDRMITAGEPPPESALAIAAPSGGKRLYERMVLRAAAAPRERHAALLEGIGAFGPELVPRVIDLLLDPRFKAAHVLPALEQLLKRPATRTAAWRAIRDRAPTIIAALAGVQLDELVVATGSLCDANASTEVVAAFAGKGKQTTLDQARTSIDRCVSRRLHVAKLARALAP